MAGWTDFGEQWKHGGGGGGETVDAGMMEKFRVGVGNGCGVNGCGDAWYNGRRRCVHEIEKSFPYFSVHFSS